MQDDRFARGAVEGEFELRRPVSPGIAVHKFQTPAVVPPGEQVAGEKRVFIPQSREKRLRPQRRRRIAAEPRRETAEIRVEPEYLIDAPSVERLRPLREAGVSASKSGAQPMKPIPFGCPTNWACLHSRQYCPISPRRKLRSVTCVPHEKPTVSHATSGRDSRPVSP